MRHLCACMHEKCTRSCHRFAGRQCTAQYANMQHNTLWMQHNAVSQTVHTTCCSRDDTMNRPDTEAVDEVKTLILKSVNTWKNYKKRVSPRGSQGACAPRSAQTTSNVYSQLSGLEDVVFNDFIKDDFIPEGHGQVTSGSASLPDPVALETEEQTLEREQNERDVLESWASTSVTPECLSRMCLRLLK